MVTTHAFRGHDNFIKKKDRDKVYTLCLRNDTDVALYNFKADQPILIIFGRDAAERVYATKQSFVIPPLLTNVSALFGETWTPENCLFSHAAYRTYRAYHTVLNHVLMARP